MTTLDTNLTSLSSEQIEMLMMSERDIDNGNLISESGLGESDQERLS